MKKELKDYLHLYIGCKMEYEYKFTTKEGSELRKARLNYVGINGVVYFVDLTAINKNGEISSTGTFRLNIRDVKPILRPLSDMTEDEKESIGRGAWHHDYYPEISDSEFDCEEVRLMLSMYFDLFGLIESGLAIDQTTLTPITGGTDNK